MNSEELDKIINSKIETRLLDKTEAAELLHIKPSTLDSWASSGKVNLPYIRVGALRRYRLEDLRLFMNSNRFPLDEGER